MNRVRSKLNKKITESFGLFKKTDSEQENRTQRRAIDTRNKIYDTAINLFTKKGFERTTVSDITHAADVGKGTFFSHFPTKESVLSGIGEKILAQMIGAADSKSTSPAESIRNIFLAACRWHEGNPKLSKLFTHAIISFPKAFEADGPSQDHFAEFLSNLIQEGQAKKKFRSDFNARAMSESLGGAYFYSVLRWHQTGRKSSLSERVDEMLVVVLRGMKPL